MRYAWVGLAVVLLDLLGKLLAAHGVYSAGLDIPLGFLNLRLFGSDADVILLSQPVQLNLGTGLLLLVPMVAVLLLLLLDRPLLMSYTLFGIGVQLLAGCGLAEALTRLMSGDSPALITYAADGRVIVSLMARHIALVAGAGVLAADQWLRLKAHRVQPPALQHAPAAAIKLTGLRCGDDNVHIDAALSPLFMRDARRGVTQLVNHYLTNAGKSTLDPLAVKSLQAVRDGYAGMLHVAINRSRPTGETSRIELLRLAVLMYLREQIRNAIAENIERHYERSRGAFQRAGELRGTRQRAAEGLPTAHGAVFHQVCRQLFLPLAAHEQNMLRGTDELLPGFNLPALFSVPLLQAATPEDDDVLMEYYTLLGHRRSDAYSFRHLDALFDEVFPSSPEQPSTDNKPEAAAATGAGVAPSVLDVPENITSLLDVDATKEALRAARSQGKRALVSQLRTQLRFRRLQLASLRLALERAGLVTTLLALYETPQLYSRYAGAVAPQVLLNLLRSPQSRRRIGRRLGQTARRASDQSPLSPILAASRRVRRRSQRDISAMLLRFAQDFSTYRRDFRLYLATQEAVSRIRLLYTEREVINARLNRRLYEFLTPDEVAVSAEAVAGHVILKADLRGSTQMTEQLVRRELNPATYLSRNFYEPMTALISHCHGEKVFIEGDAIILMFLETADPHRERLAVANACGLAVRLLEMVASNNARNASYDLPPLEVGIGITWQPGSPTYVFDGATRIVISPAINRADRLSSSAGELRKHIFAHQYAPHVAVFHALESGGDPAGKRSAQLIYNVDGIALEPAAFRQLATELPLYRVVDVPEGVGDGELFAAPAPSSLGKHRRLVVRRARICALNEAPLEIAASSPSSYYEVIAVPALLEMLARSPPGEPLVMSCAPESAAMP